MDKDYKAITKAINVAKVSTLVLMDSWIKTLLTFCIGEELLIVSTLVLMDSWIKTYVKRGMLARHPLVSTLVLMDSWIKTLIPRQVTVLQIAIV